MFNVPRYLSIGDPYEKPFRQAAGARIHAQYQNNIRAEWWREHLCKERPQEPVAATRPVVMDAHPAYAAQWAGNPQPRKKLQSAPPLLYGLPQGFVPQYYVPQ